MGGSSRPFEMESIFVIGYPKSGNTWLARLLADVLDAPMRGGDNPIDRADGEARGDGPYVVYKSHYSQKSKPEYISESTKVFYIIRDFRDVVVSGFFHFHRRANEEKYALESSMAPILHRLYRWYFKHHIYRLIKKWQGRGITQWVNKLVIGLSAVKRFAMGREMPNPLSVGNWSEHVTYWIESPNVTVVKYESLLADTYLTLRESLRLMGIQYSEERLRDGIRRQSFGERKKHFQEIDDQANVDFMRKGKAGDWERFLDRRMIIKIKEAHGPVMNRLGYRI